MASSRGAVASAAAPLSTSKSSVAGAPPAARWLVLLTVALFPLGNWPVPGLGTTLAAPLLLAGSVSAALVLLAHRRSLIPRSPILGAAGCLVVSALLSTLVAVDLRTAVALDVVALVGLAFATLVVSTHRRRGELWTLLAVLTGTVALMAGWSLANMGETTVEFGGGVVEGRLHGLLTDPNELGAFMAWTLPVAVALALGATRLRSRILFGACAVLMAAALAMSFSRGSWIGCLAGMAALGLMLPSTRRTLLLLAVPFAAALAWLWWQPPAGGVLGALAARLRAGTSLTANPYDARPAIWEEAWRQVGDRPMLGAGPYGYAATTQQGDNPLNAVAPEHAHSLYLTVAAEQGLVGLTALMALIVCCMSAVRPTRRPRMNQDHKFLVAAPAAGLVALAVQGLVDYPLRNALVSALAWLLLGTLAAGARANRLAAARPRESG